MSIDQICNAARLPALAQARQQRPRAEVESFR
jgi:hypothetical protein